MFAILKIYFYLSIFVINKCRGRASLHRFRVKGHARHLFIPPNIIYILISTSTPAGKLRFIRASINF